MEEDEYHRPTSEVLRIGRDFQNTDRYRGCTFDTAKLLCDHIERLDAFVTEMSDAMADIRLMIAKKLKDIPTQVTPHEAAILTRCERILGKVDSEILTDTMKPKEMKEESKRKVIGFSHHYPKIHGQTSARLLAVESIRIDKSTPQELLEYDTTFDGGNFELKTGNYIQLIFLGNLRIPFCTIRPAWPKQKMEYYKAAIGETFAIKYKGEPLPETEDVNASLKGSRTRD